MRWVTRGTARFDGDAGGTPSRSSWPFCTSESTNAWTSRSVVVASGSSPITAGLPPESPMSTGTDVTADTPRRRRCTGVSETRRVWKTQAKRRPHSTTETSGLAGVGAPALSAWGCSFGSHRPELPAAGATAEPTAGRGAAFAAHVLYGRHLRHSRTLVAGPDGSRAGFATILR